MNNKDRIEFLIEQVITANRSAIWWQREMNSCLRKLKKREEEDPYLVSEERDETEQKMEYLIAKGGWEDNNLDTIMSQVDIFPEEQKRQIVSEIGRRWEERRESP